MAKEFRPTVLCTICKGHCCKRYPGAALPSDFEKPLMRSLVKAFESGNWAIDWWEARYLGYFVRPAIKGVSQLYDPSWGGECIFLTDRGCRLLFEQRPMGCRYLKPAPTGTNPLEAPRLCTYHGGHTDSKWEAAVAWKPYRSLIHAAAKKSRR